MIRKKYLLVNKTYNDLGFISVLSKDQKNYKCIFFPITLVHSSICSYCCPCNHIVYIYIYICNTWQFWHVLSMSMRKSESRMSCVNIFVLLRHIPLHTYILLLSVFASSHCDQNDWVSICICMCVCQKPYLVYTYMHAHR